jgi:hypothetical protein
MPPEDKLKIGLDPVFKSNQSQNQNNTNPNIGAGAYNILNNQKYSPSQTVPAEPFKSLESNPNAPKSIVRTYKGDLATAIAANHLSSINIAIAENQKMQEQIRAQEKIEAPVESGEYSKNKIIIFISIILVLIGIIAIAYVYFTSTPNSQTVRVQELPALITTEYKDELNINTVAKNKFGTALSSKLFDFQIPVNNLYNTYLTTGTGTARRLINTGEFISITGFRMPDIIKRTLLPDFMVGTYSMGGNFPFIILKTSYFENAFAGMIQWETNMEKDLQVIFRLPGYENAGGLSAILAPTTVRKFTDSVIANKDVRIMQDDKGENILLYSIIDKETIIITVNDIAFKEILNRLNKEKTLKR